MYEPRNYRGWVSDRDLFSFSVVVRETDLLIRATRNLKGRARAATQRCRAALEKYIQTHPGFVTSLEPIPVDEDAPHIVMEMARAARQAGVGPMAAVAGAVAEAVGRELLLFADEVIVENGGDIFMKSLKERLVGVYAGESSLSGGITFAIQPWDTPLGICTSSGSVGHSLSLGRADAVVVTSESTALADAAATAIANMVKSKEDIPAALEFAQGIERLAGVAIIKDDSMGLRGQLKIAGATGK